MVRHNAKQIKIMKTKTISYVSGKLDRTMGKNLSTTEIVVEKVKKAMIHLGKVLMSMMENGQKQLIRIEGERMKHIIEVSRRKRTKVMYKQWSNPEEEINTQQLINDIRFGRL
jgi:phenylpyruvate tautomerase PptA (4-oxalocrotonate tautomerase family)